MLCSSPRYSDNSNYCPNSWGTNSSYSSNNYYTYNNNQQYPNTPVVFYPSLYSTVNQNQIHFHLHGGSEKIEQYLGPDTQQSLPNAPRAVELPQIVTADGVHLPETPEDPERTQAHNSDPASVWRPY